MKSALKEIVLYYKRKIDRNISDEKVVVDSIYKVSKLPVTAEVLHDTGIYNFMQVLSMKGGGIGAKALPIYNKWRLLMTIAMKDKDSPIKSPDEPCAEERSLSTTASTSNHASRSSADSNTSHCSRDNGSGRNMKYSDPSQFGRRDQFDSEFTDRDARSSSSFDFNGLNTRDSYHLYEDGSFNPHLSIDNSEKMGGPDETVDQNGGTKGRILEPYAIEMREGMFRVVKVKGNALSQSGSRARQLYHKEFLKKSTTPYNKKERDKSESSKNSSPGKSGYQPSNGERSKRKGESSMNSSGERHSSSSDKASKPKTSSEGRHSTYAGKSDGKGSSPSLSGESRGSDQRRLERKSTPDSVPDKHKVKAIKEEKSSHVSKSSNADNLQANCDRKAVKLIDSPDDSAMNFITSKKERRAVYSGKKTAVQVTSLKEFCIRSLKKSADSVKSTRGVPYNVLKPFLEYLSPSQLYRIEEQNRYLLKETDELWKQHCNKIKYRGPEPSKNENWRVIYFRTHKEQDRKLKTITANISASSMKTRPDRQAKITLVDSPHDPQRKRMKRSSSPIVPPHCTSPSVSSKSSPQVPLKASPSIGSKSSPSVSSKSVSPNVGHRHESSKSSSKEPKPHHPKQPKKADAPLMSKLKKSMGLAYRSK